MGKLVIILLILLLILIFIGNNEESFNTTHEIKIMKVAKTPEEQRNGLMFIKDKLPEKTGMLFTYENPRILSFWMKNTYIDLDILFLDENYKIIGFCENLKKHTLHTRNSNIPAKHAIELNSGTIKKYNLKKNDYVRLIYEVC